MPHHLRLDLPEIYEQLKLFYRQDPAVRCRASMGTGSRSLISARAPAVFQVTEQRQQLVQLVLAQVVLNLLITVLRQRRNLLNQLTPIAEMEMISRRLST